MSRRCAFAYIANAAPAPTDPTTPSGSTAPVPSPPSVMIATPASASTVATSHTGRGARRRSIHSSSPARTGADPRATTVPIATPLREVPRKNSG